MALGRVLTLLIVVDEQRRRARPSRRPTTPAASTPAGSSPSSSATSAGQSRLDAQIRVGGDAGASEVVVLRLYGAADRPRAQRRHPAAAARLPRRRVVAHGRPAQRAAGPHRRDGPAAHHRRRRGKNPRAATQGSGPTTYAPGDTDLAWTRITLWRGLLAAALDQPPYEPVLSATVTGGSDSPVDRPARRLAGPGAALPGRRARSSAGTGHRQRAAGATQRDIDLVRPDGAIATLRSPVSRTGGSPCPPARCRVPGRRAAPPRPRRDLRGGRAARACACSAARARLPARPSRDGEAPSLAEAERRRAKRIRACWTSALSAATWSQAVPTPPMPATPPR